MHGRMEQTKFRPNDPSAQQEAHRRKRRGLDFIGEFYHWFAGVATDSQIWDMLSLINTFGEQLNATSRFVETNARTIQSLSRTTAEEFQSLAEIITRTQDALKQSSEVMNENFDLLKD